MNTLNKFFDFTLKIDSFLYGLKMKIFLISSFIIVVLFNMFDFLKINSSPWDIFFMLFYFLFILNTFFAWIGSWRDDEGNWTMQRFTSKIKMYLRLLKDSQKKYKNKSQYEYLYFLGLFLFFFGICAKSIVLLTKYLSYFSSGIISISFDKYIQLFSISLFAGVLIILYIGYNHKELLNLKDLISWKVDKDSFVNKVKVEHDYIIDIKNNSQVETLMKLNKNSYFYNIINVLNNWSPKEFYNEYQYQDDLEYHFRLNLEGSKIEIQKNISNSSDKIRGIPDIVINENVLIEMKAKKTGSEFDRVQGQLNKYIRLWNEKGPVVLIVNNVGYDTVNKRLSQYFAEQQQLNKNIIAFVI